MAWAAWLRSSTRVTFSDDSSSSFRPSSALVPSIRTTMGGIPFSARSACQESAPRDHVAAEDASEYVDEYLGDVPVGQDYLQRLGYLFLVRAASHVEEVGRSAVPAAKVTSIVAIARPAPLTMHPTSPSSLT